MLAKLRSSRPVGILRYHAYRDVLLAWPRRHTCNICGWRGRHFLTYEHTHILCPQCGAMVRHRLLAAALELPAVAPRLRLTGTVVHLSPEYCLGLVFRRRAGRYVRADWAASDCDVRQDATRLAFLSGSADVVVACDMLEHIPDDRRVLSELYRVLRPGGTAIVSVPQSDDAQITYEDASIATPADRARAYGQPDHVRNYGLDFADRISEAGFTVISVEASDFDPETVARHVLRPPVPLHEPWGWNNRRVYFAERG